MKIFFSYGHDHHAEFIQKIRQDLINKYGLNIWIDNIELKAKADWARQIEKGIEDSDEIVYFLTPHSARRDDGFCLNELAYACIYNKPIIPVMVDYVVPPVNIARIQYIDIQHLTENNNDEKYNQFLDNLVSVINGDKELNFQSDQFDLLNYLNPLDFRYDMSKHLKNFVGREWLYKKVDEFLENEESRVLWITAEAGFGKTSFSTYLMHNHKHLIAIHYCKYDNPKRKDPVSVLTTLIYQLSTQVPQYKEILNSARYKLILNDLEKLNMNEILDQLLIQPLHKIKKMDENYFFIIDALDETLSEDSNELVDLILQLDDLPEWLKIVVTSRPEPYLKRKLSKLQTIELDVQSEENLDDLKLYLQDNENEKNCQILKDTSVVSSLIQKSEGNILYLKEVIDAMKKGSIKEDELTSLPSGMTGLYLNMFERYFPDVDDYEESVMPIFELLCASNQPLSKELITDILNIKKRDFKKIIDSIGSLIETNEKNEIYFFHKTLTEWLLDEDLCSDDYFVDVNEGHERISKFIEEEYSGGKYSQEYNIMFLKSLKVFSPNSGLINQIIFNENLLCSFEYRDTIDKVLIDNGKITNDRNKLFQEYDKITHSEAYSSKSFDFLTSNLELAEKTYNLYKSFINIIINYNQFEKNLFKELFIHIDTIKFFTLNTIYEEQLMKIIKEHIEIVDSFIKLRVKYIKSCSALRKVLEGFLTEPEIINNEEDQEDIRIISENIYEVVAYLAVHNNDDIPAHILSKIERLELIAKSLIFELDIADHDCHSLNNMSDALDKVDKPAEESLQILKYLYDSEPDRWAEDYATELNHMANNYSKLENYNDANRLYLEAVNISRKFLDVDKEKWIEDYLIYCSNLANSFSDIEEYSEALKYYLETFNSLSELYTSNMEKWYDDLIDNVNNIGHYALKLRQYEQSCEYYKKYFEILDMDKTITSKNELSWLIYPFVQYYQAAIHSNKDLEPLEKYINEKIAYLKNKFGDEYSEQIEFEHEGYKPIRDSNDGFENEKYEIFVKVFLKIAIENVLA